MAASLMLLLVAVVGVIGIVMGLRALIRRRRRPEAPASLSLDPQPAGAAAALSPAPPEGAFAAAADYRGYGSEAETSQAAVTPTASLIKRRGKRDFIEGEARHVQRSSYVSDELDPTGRGQAVQGQVLHFRLLVRDAQGREVRQYDVQLRGPGITGSIQNGDVIAVPAKFIRDDVCEATYVYNRRTGAMVSVDPNSRHGLRTFAKVVFTLIVLGGFLLFVLMVTGNLK
jgi:hypothetical protein